MAALINTAIAQQAFELVRDRIGAILKLELENQAVAFGNYYADAEVFVERFAKINADEDSVISVSLAEGTYDGQTVMQADGTYTFNVDGFCKSTTVGKNKEEAADHLAMLKLNRLLGLCRAILQDSRYLTLGFAKPFIMSRQVSRVQIAQPKSEDEQSHVMGRLQVVVKVGEVTNPQTAVDFGGVATMVKLCCTDLGFLWESTLDVPDTPPDSHPCEGDIPTPSDYFSVKVLLSLDKYKVAFLTTSAPTYTFDGTETDFNPESKDLRGMVIDELFMGGFMWNPLSDPPDYELNSNTGLVFFNKDIVPNDYCVIKFKPSTI